ncbi:MAG: phosphatidylglycerophosphatase A, partial [Verrucomicrobiota bacterium]
CLGFDPDSEIQISENQSADFVAVVGKPAAAEFSDEFEFAAKRGFKRYASLSKVVGDWAETRVPKGICKLIASISKKLGFDTHVGARMAGVGVKGCEEWILARRGVDRPQSGGAGEFWVKAIASFFGTGHIPLAGATLASLFTVILAIPTWKLLVDSYAVFWWIWFAVLALSTLGCVITEKAAGRIYLAKDPREVVLDETAGMAMTLLFIPPQLWALSSYWPAVIVFTTAFFAFRFFDVLKIGVRWVERYDWPGSIVWDDILAGIYAGLVTMGVSFALTAMV